MTQQFDTEVLICGAGAAGLTLAIELARRRIAFRLIDKLEGPFRGSRGKGIQPRSQEIFEDLGILDHLVAVGGVYPSEHTYGNDGSVLSSEVIEVVDPTPDEPYHMRLMVPQFLTEGVMRERLAEFGHRVEFGSELLDFVQDAEGVTSRIKTSHGEESVRARYLVGVDGGRSFVRQALGIDFPGKTLGVRAVVADMHLRGLSADIWHHFNEGSMELQVSLCPLAGTDMFQLQAPVPLEGEIDVSPQGLTALIAGRTSRQGIVVEAVHWASVFSMNVLLSAIGTDVSSLPATPRMSILRPAARGSIPAYRTLITSAGSWPRCWVAHRSLCSIRSRRSAARLRPGCWVSRPGCSIAQNAVSDAVAAKSVNSISVTRSPRSPWSSPSVTTPFAPAIGRLMPLCVAQPASLFGCSTCFRGRTGPCSGMKWLIARRWRLEPD